MPISLLTMISALQNAFTMADSDIPVQHSHATGQPSSSSPADHRTSRSLNVLYAIHVARDPHTAVYKNTCDRAASLEALGHRCTILTPDDFPWINRIGGRFTPLLYPIAITLWLALQKQEFDVAIFHSHAGWTLSLLRRYLALFRGLRIAIMFHGLEPLYFARLEQEVKLSSRYRILHGNIMLRLLRASCRDADLIMCLNTEESRYLVENQWATRDRVTVIANPAPSPFFVRRPYAPRANQLLFVGQWLPMKGTQYLVEAFTALHRNFPHLHLCCAGTLDSEDRVLNSFPEHVRDRVTVHPRVSQDKLLRLYEQADIFVFPTLSEGFSLALTEAMATGLPIVTTPVGAAPDVLQHQRSVLFVAQRDSSALVAAVENLVANQSVRELLGRAAQRSAENLRSGVNSREYRQRFEQLVALPSTRQETLEITPITVKGSRGPVSADPIRLRP